jgi:hypothetical protein
MSRPLSDGDIKMYWIGKPQSAMVDISNLKINFKIQC